MFSCFHPPTHTHSNQQRGGRFGLHLPHLVWGELRVCPWHQFHALYSHHGGYTGPFLRQGGIPCPRYCAGPHRGPRRGGMVRLSHPPTHPPIHSFLFLPVHLLSNRLSGKPPTHPPSQNLNRKGFIFLDHAIIDPVAAWDEVLSLTKFDSGNSLSNSLWWVATRPGAAAAGGKEGEEP